MVSFLFYLTLHQVLRYVVVEVFSEAVHQVAPTARDVEVFSEAVHQVAPTARDVEVFSEAVHQVELRVLYAA